MIDQRRLENLPVNSRSFASLAILIPGATLAPSFDPTLARVGTFSVGGSSGRNLNITIDGGDNKDNAVGGILQNFSMEGIQGVCTLNQRFPPLTGRSGGALLSVVSKSSTNDYSRVGGFFHCRKTKCERAREARLPVNPTLFPDQNDAIKPPFSREQFGGSIGGPIKRTRLSFRDLERTRERGNSIVPGSDQAQIAFHWSRWATTLVRFLPQPFNDWVYRQRRHQPVAQARPRCRFSSQNNDGLNDQAGFLIVRTDLSGGNTTKNALWLP